MSRRFSFGSRGCLVVGLMLLSTAACRDVTRPPARIPSSLQLGPSVLVVDDGLTVELVATLLDQHKKPFATVPSGTWARARTSSKIPLARTGRSFADLLADWSLAIALGDQPRDLPARPELRVLSWNEWDVFAGLYFDFPAFFPRAFPLRLQDFPNGGLSADIPTLRGGSAAFVELWGDSPKTHLVELRSLSGAALPLALGVAIVRIQ